MPEMILRQLQYESDTWKRLVCFMRDENIHLKNRLAEILRDDFDQSLLEEVEHFQNRFIEEDELINFLRNDVAKFDRCLVKKIFDDMEGMSESHRRLRCLRDEIKNAESEFSTLKLAFNSYLLDNIAIRKNGNKK